LGKSKGGARCGGVKEECDPRGSDVNPPGDWRGFKMASKGMKAFYGLATPGKTHGRESMTARHGTAGPSPPASDSVRRWRRRGCDARHTAGQTPGSFLNPWKHGVVEWQSGNR